MPATTAEIARLLTKLEDLVETARTIINQTLQKAAIVSIIVQKTIESLWNRFTNLMSRFWSSTAEVFACLGDEDKLTETARAWSDNVGGPVSGRVSLATDGELLVDDTTKWTGTGADLYRQKLFEQRTALDKIKANFTTAIVEALNDMKSALQEFWKALILGLLAAVAQFLGSLASDATVAGIPLGILLKITAVATLIGTIVYAVRGLRSDAQSAATKLNDKIDYTGYPGEFWPRAVVE